MIQSKKGISNLLVIAVVVVVVVVVGGVAGYIILNPTAPPRKVRAYSFDLHTDDGFENGAGTYPNGTAIPSTISNPTIIVRVNETLRITGTSIDLTHNIAIYKAGTILSEVLPPPSTSPKLIKRSADAEVGKTTTLDWDPTSVGTYEYYCEYHGNTMHGQIIVISAS